MTDEAYEVYCQGLEEQHSRQQARNIRKNVTAARKGWEVAALRWPFELLQNALDAGPRPGKTLVEVTLHRSDASIVFEHNGAPFTSTELAALLSGGSSKEFESEETTGRFGSGFLVTHVLAEHTVMRGILALPTHFENFTLHLDRGGDEDAIRANIQQCKDAIRDAARLESLDGVPSASFEYPFDEQKSILPGITALHFALPYLYGTRPKLGRFVLDLGPQQKETWTPGEPQRETFGDFTVESRSLAVVNGAEDTPIEYSVYQAHSSRAPVSALFLLKHVGEERHVCLPGKETPRVFREYPLRRSTFLPINFVLNGKFDPDEERSCLLMSDCDKEYLSEAFAAASAAVHFATSKSWAHAHLLAAASPTTAVFNPASETEADWWLEQLSAFAQTLSQMPIVECDDQFLPSDASSDNFADFVVPRLLNTSGPNETTVDRMWPLVRSAINLNPPRESLASEWTDLATGWEKLGITLGMITLQALADYARNEATRLEEMKVTGDAKLWLAKYLDLVCECWESRAGVDASMLTGLFPDQHGKLRSPQDVARDGGISDALKDICEQMDLDVRSMLLATGFDELATEHNLKHLALAKIVADLKSEDEIIEAAIEHLNDLFVEDDDFSGEDEARRAQIASLNLLKHLWETKKEAAGMLARCIPLFTSRGKIARWSHERMLMAPVKAWKETAQPFAEAYPPDRVLADIYVGDASTGHPDVVPALVAWGLAFHDPISTHTPARLDERRLQFLASEDTVGVSVTGETFSQIALLHPEIINRCSESRNDAKALLGLLLCHVVKHDSTWQTIRLVTGRKAGADVPLHVRGALWLSDLRHRVWVPTLDADNKVVKVQATAATLEPLLDPSWLEGNDTAIRLLSEFFGFDELNLRLIGVTSDQALRQELRNGLARLVESTGADVAMVNALTQEVAAKKRRDRDVSRYRRLGIAVQEGIKAALEQHGLDTELIDCGFDYEVTLGSDNGMEEFAMRFEVGSYLIEVKATTTGDACLTPTQAATASGQIDRYVLCVVDLRGISDERLDQAWTAVDVEPLARLVPAIGNEVSTTYSLIEVARDGSVGLRNEGALRYRVKLAVWEKGVSIATWVEDVCKKIVPVAITP